MGLLSMLLGRDDERFYKLVKKSLIAPTTGTEHNIKPFKFDNAYSYAHGFVNTDYFEYLDDQGSFRIPYNARRLSVDDNSQYIVTISKTDSGLAEFRAEFEDI